MIGFTARRSARIIAFLAAVCAAQAAAAAPRFLADSYVTRESDSLVDLAVRLDLGYLELVAANDGVDPWLPGGGAEIVIPNRHLLPEGPRKGIIVNIGDQRVYYFAGKDKPVESWPIGIGREGFDIPLQRFTVTAKRKNPTWVPPPSVRAAKPDLPASIGPGPENPLGDYALNLGSSLYRIHGTNQPYGVGRRVSSGCIRMYPADIEALFGKVSVGTPVLVVNQPAKLEWIDGELYLEVHPEGEQLDQLEVTYAFEPSLSPAFEEQVSRAAGDRVDRVDWSTVIRTWAHRTGVPMRITRAPGEEVIAETPPARTPAASRSPAMPDPAQRLGQGLGQELNPGREQAEAVPFRLGPLPRSDARPADDSGARRPGAGVW